MDIDIVLKNEGVGELVVKKAGKIVERQSFKFNRNLEEVLITGIDKILERNKMGVSSLKKMKVKGELRTESLTCQLARTFVKALVS